MVLERVVPAGGLAVPDGRFMPAGTKIGIDPAVTNRDTGVFGSDGMPTSSTRIVGSGQKPMSGSREVFDAACVTSRTLHSAEGVVRAWGDIRPAGAL